MCVSACQWVAPDPLMPLLPRSSSPLLSFNPQSLLLFFIYLPLIPTVQQPSHTTESPPHVLSLILFLFNSIATCVACQEPDPHKKRKKQNQPQVCLLSCKEFNIDLISDNEFNAFVNSCNYCDHFGLNFSFGHLFLMQPYSTSSVE